MTLDTVTLLAYKDNQDVILFREKPTKHSAAEKIVG